MDTDKEIRKIICSKCFVELLPMKTQFSYLGHSFHTDVPRCPKCGQVFIPEELTTGRMFEVETSLEDK